MAKGQDNAAKGKGNYKNRDGYEGRPVEELETNTIENVTEFSENDPAMLEQMAGAFLRSVNKQGQPTTICLMNLPTIFEMVKQGATNATIAKALGLGIRTWNEIRTNNKFVSAVVDAAEDEQVEAVKQSLFEMTQRRTRKAQHVGYKGLITEYEVEVDPDFNAVKFFLLNKDPENFHDRKEVAITRREIKVSILDDMDNVIEIEPSDEQEALDAATLNPLFEKRIGKPKQYVEGKGWVDIEDEQEQEQEKEQE